MGPAQRSGRSKLGFLDVEQVRDLARHGVIVPDPGSVLVSPGVEIGHDVVLWPSTILQTGLGGRLFIESGAVLYPGTRIVSLGAIVTIGAAEIGEEGGFTIKAEGQATTIDVGAGARLLGGGSLTGPNSIGAGAQILGAIRCQNCHLEAGGSHRHPNPDERGGVLKGSGIARGTSIPRGHVIQAFGLFAEGVLRRQSYFHPVQPAGEAV